jgi:hypothetical protein
VCRTILGFFEAGMGDSNRDLRRTDQAITRILPGVCIPDLLLVRSI